MALKLGCIFDYLVLIKHYLGNLNAAKSNNGYNRHPQTNNKTRSQALSYKQYSEMVNYYLLKDAALGTEQNYLYK